MSLNVFTIFSKLPKSPSTGVKPSKMNSQFTNKTVGRIPQNDNDNATKLATLELQLKELMSTIVDLKAKMKNPVDAETFNRVQEAANTAGIMEQHNSITALNLIHQYVNREPIPQDLSQEGPSHEPIFTCSLKMVTKSISYSSLARGSNKTEARNRAANNMIISIFSDMKLSTIYPPNRRNYDWINTHIENLIKKENDPFSFVKDLLREGIESNPGPALIISSTTVQVLESEENYLFKFDNGFSFSVNPQTVTKIGDKYHLSNLTPKIFEEVTGKLTRLNKLSLKGKIVMEGISRTPVYSDHQNFDPDLRVLIKPIGPLAKHQNASTFQGIAPETEGAFVRTDNILMVPSNSFRINYSKTWYSAVVSKGAVLTNSTLYRRILSSVKNQTLTNKNIVFMASKLATVQMTYMRIPTDFESILAVYLTLLQDNVFRLCIGRNNIITNTDIWALHQTLPEVLIPYGPIYYGRIIEWFTHRILVPTQKSLTYETVLKIIESNISDYNFDQDPNKMLDDLKTGVFNLYSTKVKPVRFDHQLNTVPRHICKDLARELTQDETFIKTIVLERMKNPDLVSCLHDALMIFIDDKEKFVEFMKIVATFQIDSFYHPAFQTLFDKPILAAPKNYITTLLDDHTHPKIEMINIHFEQEKSIAQLAQLEFNVWSKIFHISPEANVFNNLDFIIKLILARRDTPEFCMGKDRFSRNNRRNLPSTSNAPDPEPAPTILSSASDRSEDDDYEDMASIISDEQVTPEQIKENESIFKKISNTISYPFKSMKKFLTDVSDIKDSAHNVESRVNAAISDFKESLAKSTGKWDCLKDSAEAIMRFDASSIESSMRSAKGMFNAFFRDLLTKMLKTVGIEKVPNIDATTLLLYYIIWKNSPSKYMRFLILLDIFTNLGLLDLIVRILSTLYTKTAEWWTTKKTGKYDDFMANISKKTKELTEDNASRIAFAKGDETKQEMGTESFIDVVISFLESNSKPILGVIGVTMLSYFGLPTLKESNATTGSKILSSAKNIATIALGVGAIPKIYSNLIKVIDFVYDHAKALFCKEHETTLSLHRRVENFVSDPFVYCEMTRFTMAANPALCVKFLRDYEEGMKIKARISRIKDHNLKIVFLQKFNIMETFLQHAKTCMRMSFGMDEIFHIQIFGEPGIGKTDLNDFLIKKLQHELFNQDAAVFGEVGGLSKGAIFQELFASNEFGSIYKMNELLKHCDGYFNQQLGQIDEQDVFVNPSQESIINRMQILSGQVNITPQADLGSKGRVMELKALVSNTNNPFIEYTDMLKPKSVWRRRLLFQVEAIEEVRRPAQNGSGYTIDEDKIVKLKLNRTQCEHLRIRWLDELNPMITPKDIMPDWMTPSQAGRMAQALMAKHYCTEVNRSLNKNPKGALAKYTYELLMATLEKDSRPVQSINHMLKDLATRSSPTRERILRQQKELTETLAKKNVKIKAFPSFDETYEDLELIGQVFGDLDAHPGAFQASEEQLKGFAQKTSGRIKYYDLRKAKSGLFWVYYLVESKEGVIETNRGAIDLSNFHHGSPVPEAPEKFYYRATAEIDSQDLLETIHSYLCEFMFQGKSLTEAYLKKDKSHQVNANFLSKLKAQSVYYYQKIKFIIGTTTSWILKSVSEMLGSIASGICVGVAIMGLFIAMEAIIMLFAPPQSTASYDKHTPARVIIDQKTASSSNTIYQNQMYKALYKGMFVSLVGLKGNVFITVKHAFQDMDDSPITIYDPMSKTRKVYAISSADYFPMNGDSCLIVINGFRSIRDISKHFITEKDLISRYMNLDNTKVNAILLRPSSEDASFTSDMELDETGYVSQNVVRAVENNEEFAALHCNNIQKRIWLGDSGSLVVHDNACLTGAIVGILMSREGQIQAKLGIRQMNVTMVTQEMIAGALGKIKKEFQITTIPYEGEILTDHELCKVFDNQVIRRSPYPNQAVSRDAGFAKTPLYGLLDCETEPAIQTIKDPRIPPDSQHFLKVSLNTSSGKVNSVFTREEELWCEEFLLAQYRTSVPNLNKVRLYTNIQTITGIRSPGSTSMDLSTSCGLPYKLEQRGHVGKAPFITYNQITSTYSIQERLISDIAHMEEKYASGRVSYNMKSQFRKHELVGPNKIQVPKTRLVAMGNVAHHIIYMKANKDLFLKVKNVWNNGGTTPFAMGIDPERHWDAVAKHLTYHEHILDYDVKAWEEKITQRLLYMSLRVKLKILKQAHISQGIPFPPDLEAIMYGLVVDFVDSEVVFEDIVYHKRSGLLSGHPGTFMENSEIHIMIIGLIIRRILKSYNPLWATTAFILKHVKILVAADDVLLGISPLVKDIINPENIKLGYQLLEFEITAPDKTPEITFGTIHTVQFLKTHFNLDAQGIFQPKYNRSIINQLINWARTDSKLTFTQQIVVNFENALRFCYWRGAQEYEELRDLINTKCIEHRVPFQHNLNYSEFGPLIKARQAQLALEAKDTDPLAHQCD
jgi:hypothetical protein